MREWIYQTLKLSGLWAQVNGRLYQASRMTQSPKEKKHAYYRVGIASGRLHTESPVIVTPFQIFVHDEPGDYLWIDEALRLAKITLVQQPPVFWDDGKKFMRCDWVETSGDFPEDPQTGTISKFANYSITHKA